MLDLGQDLSGFLATLGQPIKQTAREKRNGRRKVPGDPWAQASC
jgi:hypothetical protein